MTTSIERVKVALNPSHPEIDTSDLVEVLRLAEMGARIEQCRVRRHGKQVNFNGIIISTALDLLVELTRITDATT